MAHKLLTSLVLVLLCPMALSQEQSPRLRGASLNASANVGSFADVDGALDVTDNASFFSNTTFAQPFENEAEVDNTSLPDLTYEGNSSVQFDSAELLATMDLGAGSGGCACIFDIDCTLSSRSHGQVSLSSMGISFRSSFCGGCHVAAITAGSYRRIPGIHHQVAGCYGGCKARAAARMARNFGIRRSKVYFFDDDAHNIASFHGTGMNAKQVACGGCGGSVVEMSPWSGVSFCR